ncbi:hypothetical protein RRG08_001989 [Elysia crispata]|uniref:Uncharacterized protein n=1 Tax=Elysia crispata TaxID=231223 RepID=A0AAE1EDB5_9GAST|nr:hypothetical protein RRG08_001989 [Elysia crispata]
MTVAEVKRFQKGLSLHAIPCNAKEHYSDIVNLTRYGRVAQGLRISCTKIISWADNPGTQLEDMDLAMYGT